MSTTTDNTKLKELNDIAKEKQNKLTAGTNITISSDNVISASGSGGDGGDGITSVTASGTSPLTLESSTSSSGAVTISGSVDLSNYATTSDLAAKQDKLTAGDNITISNNTISADVPVTKYYELSFDTYDIRYERPHQLVSAITQYYTFSPSSITYYVYEYTDDEITLLSYPSMTAPSSDISSATLCIYDVDGTAYSNSYVSQGDSLAFPSVTTTPQYAEITVTLRSGIVLTKRLYCREQSNVNSNWNYYLFEGGSSASTVTIDGSSVSVPANTIVEGNFTADITAIGTNNLKRIIIRGDVSLSICSSSSTSNTTLEEVDLTFSPSYSRSFDYMFYNLRGLKRLRVVGGQATGAYFMCYYVGSSTDDGCEIDIKGMDFSQMTSSNGVGYMCQYAKIASIDLSGHTFGGNAYEMFYNATVGSADVSGCTFNGSAYYMFNYATVNSVDVSGCTFSGSAYSMFYYATVGSADVSGCTFSGGAYTMFYYATVGSADVSGCTFGGNAYGMFHYATVGSADVSGCTFSGSAYNMFYYATVNSADVGGCTFKDSNWGSMFRRSVITDLNLSGCNLSNLSINGTSYVWYYSTISSINLNGVILPTADSNNYYFIDDLNHATAIGAITGDYGEIMDSDNVDLSSMDLKRGSVITILNALMPRSGSTKYLFLSSYSGARLSDADVALATKKGWTVSY